MASTVDESERETTRRQLLTGIGALRLLLVVLVVVGAVIGIVLKDGVTLAEIRDAFAAAGAWAPLLFIVVYVVATVVYVPGPFVTMAGGLLFGAYWGTLYAVIGAVIGAVISFLIARHLARHWFEQKLGPSLRAFKHGVDDEGGWFVLFARLMPVFPYAVLNYGFGLTRIGLMPYTVGTLIGTVPATFAYSYLGEAGLRVVEGENNVVRMALVAIGLVSALVFVPRLVLRVRRRMREERAEGGASS